MQPNELEQFLRYAYLFKGLSVTVPLKERVLPYVVPDEEAKAIGAVNTIKVGDQLYGYNTDGKGALEALGDVEGKRVHIMGAGGSARAIAFEAKKRGALVSIENRNRKRAEDLAKLWDLKVGRGEYDILVNTTPIAPPIVVGTTLFDIRSKPPAYLERARDCDIVFGFEMFINQAIEQFRLWKG